MRANYGGTMEKLDFLDVLRGLAVLGVVTVHTAAIGLSTSTSSIALAVGAVFASGRFGVEVFFLLSGFLMCSIYESREVGARRYLAARFFRIWPLWICFSLFWAGVYILEGNSLSSVLWGVALAVPFLLWLSPEHFDSFLPGAWSIQIEVYCYVIFWLLREKTASVLLSLATIFNILAIFSSFFSLEALGLFESMRRLALNTGLNFFVLGWLIARIYKIWKTESSLTVHRLTQVMGHGWTGPFATFLWLATFLFSPAIYGNPIDALGFSTLTVLSALALGGLRHAQSIVAYLGRRSYFIFFSHFVILYFLSSFESVVFDEPFSFVATPILVVLVVVVCTLLAEISFRFFEAPLMRVARKT